MIPVRVAASVCAALCLTACSTANAPGSKPAHQPNVLLVTIDTLRADRVGRGLTPAIDGLAARGVRFTNIRCVVPLTLPSHTSIMTGALPTETGVRVNGTPAVLGDRPTIAGTFKAAGYRTAAFVGAYVLDRRFGLSGGFDVYDDRVDRDPSGATVLEAQRRGDIVTDAALAWLSASDSRPFFAWVHLYDPHAPYEPPAEYLEKANGNAYDGEVAFADAQVGRLLDWLKTSGREGDTVVAVTGDHGEGLGDHGEATHGMLLYDSTLRVPLVIAGPHLDPRVRTEPASLVQLAATLVSFSGSLPHGMRQRSLLSLGGDDETYSETEYPRTAGWHSLAALAFDRWKVIASSEDELYDLTNDPGETQNLAAQRGAVVEGARNRLTQLRSTGKNKSASTVSADAAERLRALGYVSGGPTAADDDHAPNPAKRIAAWSTFEKELARLTSGDARRALPGLASLARSFPDAPVFQSTYARALKETGRIRDAVDVYRRAVARWPQDAELYHDLAVAAGAAGMSAEAARAEQAALALEPSNAAAANGLGLAQVQSGKPDEAVKWFEQAVKADPSNAVYWTNLGNARRDVNDAAGAEQAYRNALDNDPRSVDAANGMGVLLVQSKRSADAIPWFERALAGAPRFAEARLNLGIAYQENGNGPKAAEQYRRVLEVAPAGSREYQAAAALLRQSLIPHR